MHDIARRYNVKMAVVDREPETREARRFQLAEPYDVYLADYQENMKVAQKIDEEKGLIIVRRTEICDTTHKLVTEDQLEIPRRSSEVEKFADEMGNIVKVMVEDEETGDKVYRYRKLGAGRDDHYRHTLNYLHLASKLFSMVYVSEVSAGDHLQDERNNENDPFDNL